MTVLGAICWVIVSAGIIYRYPRRIATLAMGVFTAVVSAWIIVATQVFSLSTVQDLTLASASGDRRARDHWHYRARNRQRARSDPPGLGSGEHESGLAAAAWDRTPGPAIGMSNLDIPAPSRRPSNLRSARHEGV
jgi:hypothetical protein